MAITIYLKYGSTPTYSYELTARSAYAVVNPDSIKLVQRIEDDLTVMDAGDLTLECSNYSHWWEQTFESFPISARYPDTWYVELYKGGVLRWQGDVDPASVRYDHNKRTCAFTVRGILKRLEKYPASLVKRDFRIGAYTGYSSGTGASYIDDSQAHWETDQWVGWVVLDAAALPSVRIVTSNTATRLNFASGTPTSGRYRIIPYVATATAGTALGNRILTFDSAHAAADIALFEPYDVIRHVPYSAQPRVIWHGDDYAILLPRFEWKYQDLRCHYVGPRVNTVAPQVTLTNKQILIMEDLEYSVAKGDGLIVQTPYYRNISIEDYVQYLFQVAGADGRWAALMPSLYLGTLIPYADAGDKTVAEALTELAALFGASLYADGDVYKIVGRDLVDPTISAVDLSDALIDDNEAHAWEHSVDYVVAEDALGSQVWRGALQLSGKRLEVKTDYILPYNWLQQVCDRNYSLFGGRRKVREVTVADSGAGVGYATGVFDGLTQSAFPSAGWTLLNGTSTYWNVVDGSTYSRDGNVLEWQPPAGDAWSRIARTDIGQFKTVDVTAKVYISHHTTPYTARAAWLCACLDPAGGYNQGIVAKLELGTGLVLQEWVSGSLTDRFSHLVAPSAATWYNVRLQVGTLVSRAKYWAVGDDEPTTWQVTSTAPTPAAGYVGVAGYYGNNLLVFDDVLLQGEPSFSGAYSIGSVVKLPKVVAPSNMLSENAEGIETSGAAWTDPGATSSQSGAEHHSGSYSLEVITGGSSAYEGAALVDAERPSVTPGEVYSVYAWVKGSGASLQLYLQWETAGGAYISGVFGTASALTGSWQQLVVNGQTAPATAALLRISILTSATAATTFYLDDVFVLHAATIDGTSTTPEHYTVWGVEEDLRAFEEASAIKLTCISERVYDRPLVYADFNGTSGYIDCDDYCDLPDSFTVEMWVDSDDWTGANGALISKIVSLGITGWKISFSGAGVCQFYAPNLSTATFNINIGSSGPVHIAVVKDGTTVTTYVDGEQDTQTTSVTGSITGNTDHLCIGASPGPYDWYDGRLRDVRVWNLARTQAEIQRYMHLPLIGTETGLIGYWPLDEGYGGAIHDGSPTGADGLFYSTNWSKPSLDEYNTKAKPERPTIVSLTNTGSDIEIVFDINVEQENVLGWFGRVWPSTNSRDETGYVDLWMLVVPYRDGSGRQINGRFKAYMGSTTHSGKNIDISTVAYDGRCSEPSDAEILP